MARSTSFVNKHPCNPYRDSLTNRRACSSEDTRITGTTGPKGSSQASRISAVTWSTSTGHTRLSSRRHGWQSVAPFSTESFTRASTKSALFLLTKAVTSQLCSGRPTVSLSTLAATLAIRVSAISSKANTNFTAVHRCPEYENPPLTIAAAARSRSASGNTRHASFPPSSICSGTMPVFFATCNPVSPPVKDTKFASGCVVR
mmetsp:Transcript_6853/g.25905  ORF Transcript_6853/g.25905 Transcript_6853/m.25905 type:complete len:202 (-) Transcript_6853:799-1404(-)